MNNWQIMGVLTILIIGTVLMSGCTNTGSTSAAVSAPTPQIVTTTPTPTPNPQLESDKLFLSTAINYNDEISTASKIFDKVLTEENRWLSNVKLKEQDYQNALEDLATEQDAASTLTTKYVAAMNQYGGNVAMQVQLTIAYRGYLADRNKLIDAADIVASTKKTAMDAAKKPIDLKAKGLDVNVLNATCTRAINQLSPIQVSPKLQPIKDQYLTALSNFKKGGDSVATAVNYFNQGQVSSGTDSYNKGTAFIETGTNQLDSTTLLIQQYKTNLGI